MVSLCQAKSVIPWCACESSEGTSGFGSALGKETLQDTAEGKRRKRDGEREREELSVHCIPDWLERGG